MPHFLCFTDLLATEGDPGEPALVDAAGEPAPKFSGSSAPTDAAEECNRHPIALFALEENKKSSFALQRPYALHSASQRKPRSADVPTSTARVVTGATGDSISAADEENQTAAATEDNGDSHPPAVEDQYTDGGLLPAADVNTGEKEKSIAEAAITSFASTGDNPEQCTPHKTKQPFLFGGFELISNVKTVEVHVIRSNASEKVAETYLTTCKGIPARDVAPLETPVLYLDGTEPEPSERLDEQGEGIDTEEDSYYKLILVSPGGPKPVERVRLKFVRSNTSCAPRSIVVRTLKVKGRLSDSTPASNASTQQSTTQSQMPFGVGNVNPAMALGQRNNEMAGLASMMAMMGGRGAMGMPVAQMNPMQMQMPQQQLSPMPMQIPHQTEQQHRQQERYQAEIMSSIAGLGMFLKSSEERTTNKLETMLSGMEERIMKRLDGLAERLDAIEQSINEPDEDDPSSSDTFHENDLPL